MWPLRIGDGQEVQILIATAGGSQKSNNRDARHDEGKISGSLRVQIKTHRGEGTQGRDNGQEERGARSKKDGRGAKESRGTGKEEGNCEQQGR